MLYFLASKTPVSKNETPENPPRLKFFFPRPHLRPCGAIRNGLAKQDLTPINLKYLKQPVLPLVLLSDTPENPCFEQAETVSPGWKIRVSGPFYSDATSKVAGSAPQSGQSDPQKWSVWGTDWLWKFEKRLRNSLKVALKFTKNRVKMAFFEPNRLYGLLASAR